MFTNLYIRVLCLWLAMFSLPWLLGSQTVDTLLTLEAVTVKSYRQAQTLKSLPTVHHTFLLAGRRNEVVLVAELPANLAEKNGRQLFGRIPGAFLYDMDGSGNQVNLAVRGLDPHRSWEFNVRQNGVVINSDIYGYPASHYSMPMEAVQQVELVRGTGSLQYGAAFGGMINYVLKGADTTRAIGFESLNTVGSYGLFASYNALGGKVGKLTYYGYFHKRTSDGYRQGGSSNSDAQFLSLGYAVTPRLRLRAELARSTYLYRIPGPLTDSMFYANPRQNTRSRNFYSPEMYVPSLTLDWEMGPRTTLNWVLSGVFGLRNSVQFEGFANQPDLIDPATLAYRPRVVDIDRFRSRTSELRLLHRYQIGRVQNVLSAGVRYFNNRMQRRQQGQGTTGADYDLTVTGDFRRNLFYHSQSIALSVENMVQLGRKLSVSPGIRYEHGQTDLTGYLSYLDPADIPNTIRHRVPALGISMEYRYAEGNRLYAGIAQAYRPVLFKDVIPGSTLERANPNLENAFGYNAEVGVGGARRWLKYDLTLFMLQYNNRMGNLALTDETGADYIYKTNIGDSRTQGVELYAQAQLWQTPRTGLALYTATTYMDARYQNARLAVGGANQEISGNQVESVPHWISRSGLDVQHLTAHLNIQYAYVGDSFADPFNTVTPTANGARGLTPAYGVWDVNAAVRLAGRYTLRVGVNNLTNRQYFTKRPLFYPGPGVWSADGRSLVCSLGVKI